MNENLPVTVSQKAMMLRESRHDMLVEINKAATEGLFAGLPPMITLRGTRFVVKDGGLDKVLDSTKIGVVVMRAKGPFDKTYYATAFNKDEDGRGPDCFSRDGVHPDSSAELKQHTSCAGCPRNVFGTAKDQNGNPTGGKACNDLKILAVTPGDRDEKGNLKAYHFKIPSASLTAWNRYVQELDMRGMYLPEVITIIGFDPAATFPKLTFTMGGTVTDEVIEGVYTVMDSDEVRKIIGEKVAVPSPSAPSPAAEPQDSSPVVEESTFGNLVLAPQNAVAEPVKAEKSKRERLLKSVDAKPEPIKTEAASFEAGLGMPSDDDLRAKLGL